MKDDKLRCEKWAPCQPGTIQEASQDGPISRRNLFTLLGAGAVLGAVGGGTALGIVFSESNPARSNEIMPAGIACIKVHENLAAYVAGKLEDRDLKKRITHHLLKCDSCRKEYDSHCCSSDSGCGSRRPSKATLKPCARNVQSL
jgi:hypothetical protein